jgi:hypothetical protein
VDYTLKCFVKHDSLTQIGEGNVVYLPIKIGQPLVAIMAPQNIPYPENWLPAICDKKEFEVIGEAANYNTAFLVPNDAKWAAENGFRNTQ